MESASCQLSTPQHAQALYTTAALRPPVCWSTGAWPCTCTCRQPTSQPYDPPSPPPQALSAKGMASLQSYLASSGGASLARLNLASNSLGEEGVVALAGAWAGLQQLDLSQCGVQQQVGAPGGQAAVPCPLRPLC
jgi:hypothetical protein